jgi:hypothetical protein
MPDPLSGFSYPQPGWPYATGYASVDDVRSRINAGTWDPNKSTAAPSAAQVQQWLMEGTANVDVALRTRGYFVPLTPIVGWVSPLGVPTYSGIGMGAWWLLKNIAALWAAHWVQATRHGSHGQNNDTSAKYLMTLYDDLLTRIESAADNLATYGVAGDFAPEIDIAKGIQTGSLGATLADPNMAEGPIFTKGLLLGSGYEQNSPNTTPPTGPSTGI